MNHEIKPQLQFVSCGSTDRAAAAEVIANLVATGDNAQNKAAVGKDRAIPELISLIMHGLLPKAREMASEALANLDLCGWNKAKILLEVDCRFGQTWVHCSKKKMQLVHWHSMSSRAFGIAFKTSKWYR
jgi:hypothetical protein